MDYSIRALTEEDEAIVWKMLMYASHEQSVEAVQLLPNISRYVEGWGRTGDIGSVAFADKLLIGAAWLRLWSNHDQGFGYIDPSIPELAIAVLPEYRGNGIGSKLLRQVLQTAKGIFPAVCLNVQANNPVVRLYERAGFIKVDDSEIVDRVGGVSFNMLYQFTS